MHKCFRTIADHSCFQGLIIFLIIATGVMLGIQTDPELVANHGKSMHRLNQLILWIFLVEIIIKLSAEGRTFWRYFQNPWNLFDFTIIAVCFLPLDAQYLAELHRKLPQTYVAVLRKRLQQEQSSSNES